jgi:hypothetical protein
MISRLDVAAAAAASFSTVDRRLRRFVAKPKHTDRLAAKGLIPGKKAKFGRRPVNERASERRRRRRRRRRRAAGMAVDDSRLVIGGC